MDNQTVTKQCMNCDSLKSWEELAKFIAIGEQEFFLCKTCDSEGRVCFSCGLRKSLAAFKIHVADNIPPYFSAICEACDPTGISSERIHILILDLTRVKFDELPLLMQHMLDNLKPEQPRQEFDKETFMHMADNMTAEHLASGKDLKTQQLKAKQLERQKTLGLFSTMDQSKSLLAGAGAKTGGKKPSALKDISNMIKRVAKAGFAGGLLKAGNKSSSQTSAASKQTTAGINTSVRGKQMQDIGSRAEANKQQTVNTQSSQANTFIGKSATPSVNEQQKTATSISANRIFASKQQYVVPPSASNAPQAPAQAARASQAATTQSSNNNAQKASENIKDAASSMKKFFSFGKKA